jgi:hypothetical protein
MRNVTRAIVFAGALFCHATSARAAVEILAEKAAIRTEGGPNPGGGRNLWSNGRVGQSLRIAVAMPMSVFEQVENLLRQQRLDFHVLRHEPVYTSEEAARIRGTPSSSGAKALICKGPILHAKGDSSGAKLYPPFGITNQQGHGAFAGWSLGITVFCHQIE